MGSNESSERLGERSFFFGGVLIFCFVCGFDVCFVKILGVEEHSFPWFWFLWKSLEESYVYFNYINL